MSIPQELFRFIQRTRDLPADEIAEGVMDIMGRRTMMVHIDGDDAVAHPSDTPCARCAPPFEITDAMVQRALKVLRASCEYGVGEIMMRDALEAALDV